MKSPSSNEKKLYLSLAKKIGSFIEYWGFKEVHGKIWTLIFLSPEPVDANYLKDTLDISKALTSMSLKDLLYYNVIKEVKKEKPGTQKYCINEDITNVILDIIKQRELAMITEILSCSAALSQKTTKAIDMQRLQQLHNMIAMAKDLLEGMTSGEQVDFAAFEEATNLPS